MRRSLGNSRSKEERIVLPRLTDVTAMLQAMWRSRGGPKGKRENEDEDDFCHFPVRREEFKHYITPDEYEDALSGQQCCSTTLESWVGQGMGTVKDLRSTTGRLSWVGGVLPRLRLP